MLSVMFFMMVMTAFFAFGAVTLPPGPSWLRKGVRGADPFLDDNEGLEQKALDNTWKPDEPKKAVESSADLDFGATNPMGYAILQDRRAGIPVGHYSKETLHYMGYIHG